MVVKCKTSKPLTLMSQMLRDGAEVFESTFQLNLKGNLTRYYLR